jgi:hypothetical protein
MSGRSSRKRRPAYTLDERENQLVSLAADLAEKQLNNGTASSQVITHFLKLGSTTNRLEQARMQQENLLIAAKVEALASAKRIEELHEEALAAMRVYTGRDE